MLQEFLLSVTLNALMIIGINQVTKKGMILGVVSRFKGWITKPIYSCLICMSSFWGVLGFVFFNPLELLSIMPLTKDLVFYFFAYLFCLAGLMTLVNRYLIFVDYRSHLDEFLNGLLD